MRRKVGRPRNKPPSPKKDEEVNNDDETPSCSEEEEDNATKQTVAFSRLEVVEKQMAEITTVIKYLPPNVPPAVPPYEHYDTSGRRMQSQQVFGAPNALHSAAGIGPSTAGAIASHHIVPWFLDNLQKRMGSRGLSHPFVLLMAAFTLSEAQLSAVTVVPLVDTMCSELGIPIKCIHLSRMETLMAAIIQFTANLTAIIAHVKTFVAPPEEEFAEAFAASLAETMEQLKDVWQGEVSYEPNEDEEASNGNAQQGGFGPAHIATNAQKTFGQKRASINPKVTFCSHCAHQLRMGSSKRRCNHVLIAPRACHCTSPTTLIMLHPLLHL